MKKTPIIMSGLLVASLALGACGDDDKKETPATTKTTVVTKTTSATEGTTATSGTTATVGTGS